MNNGLANALDFGDEVMDLAEFNTETTELDLFICTALVIDDTAFEETAEVTTEIETGTGNGGMDRG